MPHLPTAPRDLTPHDQVISDSPWNQGPLSSTELRGQTGDRYTRVEILAPPLSSYRTLGWFLNQSDPHLFPHLQNENNNSIVLLCQGCCEDLSDDMCK